MNDLWSMVSQTNFTNWLKNTQKKTIIPLKTNKRTNLKTYVDSILKYWVAKTHKNDTFI